MIRDFQFTVKEADAGGRLDRLVAAAGPGAPRSAIQEAIARGDILVNGRTAAKGAKLQAGDRVLIRELLEPADIRVQPNPDLPLRVCHEDDELLVLDKPPGMAVHPLDARERDTLANALVARYPELATIGDEPLFPAILHRIDGDTSGLVLAARTEAAYRDLREQFRRQTIRKEYVALVHGRVTVAGKVDGWLAHKPSRPGTMTVVDGPAGRPGQRPMRAVTEYAPVRRGEGHTLLRVVIRTGVTHQIRCQLAAAGYPIVGDGQYGPDRVPPPPLPRHFLHAAAVTLRHPGTGKSARFTVPLAADLRRFLAERLGWTAEGMG